MWHEDELLNKMCVHCHWMQCSVICNYTLQSAYLQPSSYCGENEDEPISMLHIPQEQELWQEITEAGHGPQPI